MADRYLFVTGKLAAPALQATLRRAELPFEYEVAVMKITVAALMTADWIAKRLEVPDGVTRIMIPGMCQGDVDVVSDRFDVPAEKGPADLKRLPAHFGQADARSRYGGRDIRVFAEINNVPHLSLDQIVAAASYYRDSGADVIDLGLSLDRKWLDEGPAVIADLKARGFTLSIDTLDPDEILMADEAGIDYVLSLNGENLACGGQAARDARAHPRHARRSRQPRRDDRSSGGARQAVHGRPDHRADRLRASPPASAGIWRSAAAIPTSRCSWASAT